MLSKLGWKPLAERRREHRLSLLYQIINRLVAMPAKSLLYFNTRNTQISNSKLLKLPICTTDTFKHSFLLPSEIGTIGNAQTTFKQSVKNLGFSLDCHIIMNAHVSNIAWTCYFELRRVSSIRRFLTCTATATLVSAFVLSRIDYYNSLLFGSTHDVTSHL